MGDGATQFNVHMQTPPVPVASLTHLGQQFLLQFQLHRDLVHVVVPVHFHKTLKNDVKITAGRSLQKQQFIVLFQQLDLAPQGKRFQFVPAHVVEHPFLDLFCPALNVHQIGRRAFQGRFLSGHQKGLASATISGPSQVLFLFFNALHQVVPSGGQFLTDQFVDRGGEQDDIVGGPTVVRNGSNDRSIMWCSASRGTIGSL